MKYVYLGLFSSIIVLIAFLSLYASVTDYQPSLIEMLKTLSKFNFRNVMYFLTRAINAVEDSQHIIYEMTNRFKSGGDILKILQNLVLGFKDIFTLIYNLFKTLIYITAVPIGAIADLVEAISLILGVSWK